MFELWFGAKAAFSVFGHVWGVYRSLKQSSCVHGLLQSIQTSAFTCTLFNMCSFFFIIAEAKRQLIAAGFHLLKENEKWDLQPGGRYFFTRNMSSLVAFAIGKK